MIDVGIVGAMGFTGAELIRILDSHPGVRIRRLTDRTHIGKPYQEIYENFRHYDKNPETLACTEDTIADIAGSCDVIFTAIPHGHATRMIDGNLLSKVKVIDLSADFRLKDPEVYEHWYNVEHGAKDLLKEAVYGLCELRREEIKKARLVANPGCYTTCSILPLYPLIKEGVIEKSDVIIDAKSGVSGAGRSTEQATQFCEANENLKAYKITAHRHTPEIEEQIGTEVIFTPHLIPMNRGVLITAYAKLTDDYSYSDVKAVYEKYYGNEYFVRLTKEGVFPETKWVKASNFCDIGFIIEKKKRRIITVSAIDNIVKGASGQAVQNMNILFGLDEKTGLAGAPVFPI